MATITFRRKSSYTEELQRRSRNRRRANKARTEAAADRHVRNDLLPQLALEPLPLAAIKPAKRRVRKKDEAQVARISRSLRQFGQVSPILIDADARIVDGHLTVEAAKELGLEELNCIRVDHLSEDECRLLAITLNRVQERGDWDVDALSSELSELEYTGLDLAATGFETPELDQLLTAFALPETADAVPEAEGVTVSLIGDLWLCGKNRVLCGSATDPQSCPIVLDGQQAAAVVSDPPYNIKIPGVVSGLGKTKHSDFIMASGEMSDAEFQTFLKEFLTCSSNSCTPGAVIFAFMDWRQVHLLRLAADEAKLHHINTLVWDKGSGGMGGLYRSAHELVGVFCTAKKPAVNNVQLGKYGRDRTNVQHYAGANKPGSSAAKALHLHATPKPVEFISDLMLDVTDAGALVLDPFLGSGTALIAGEQTGRVVAGIELDPKFVDVAVRRWEQWTGCEAVLSGTDMTFSEIAAERGKDQQSDKGE